MNIPRSICCKHSTIPLLIAGQGVFIFETTASSCSFSLLEGLLPPPAKQGEVAIPPVESKKGLQILFTRMGIAVYQLPDHTLLSDPRNRKGISSASGATYWFSLDAQNQYLRAGIGEARMETQLYEYNLKDKSMLEAITMIQATELVTPLRLLRDPITRNVPLKVKRSHELTMHDIASNKVLPKSHLSPVAETLYDCIGWKTFALNTKDFPDFSKAIEYSIATPGLWCYETLKKKAGEFGKPNPLETYLRITLGDNNGESPGIPYVMEIWPPNHFSPVHNHAGASAIIRVLHGQIHVKLFPFLSKDVLEPFATADFKQDEITWISPTLNQTHQLTNTHKDTCITIQCYMYEKEDTSHYDYFDYIDVDGNRKQYEPDSDMEFLRFKALMKEEWDHRPVKTSCWCSY
jgi:hypothetical protein